MRSNTLWVSLFCTAVSITGWVDANRGWPWAQMVLRTALSPEIIQTIPFGYLKIITVFGAALFILRGSLHIRRLWQHHMYLQSAIACGFLIVAFIFVQDFLDLFMPIGAASVLSGSPDFRDLGFWLQFTLYGSVPTLARAAVLDVVCDLTPAQV